MHVVDLVFPVTGGRLPVHHGYALYGCLSRVLPSLHNGGLSFGLGLITGQYVGQGMLHIESRMSVMRLRLGSDDIPKVMQLAGKVLELDGERLRLGVPHIEALTVSSDLLSHFVTIKHAEDANAFQTSARKKLDEIGIGGTVTIPSITTGPRKGEPRRQILRVKHAVLVGYAMRVSGLTDDESIRLQSATHFAKRHMGAAFFIPAGGDQ